MDIKKIKKSKEKRTVQKEMTELGARVSRVKGLKTFVPPLWMNKECKKMFVIVEKSLQARQVLHNDDFTILASYVFNIYQYTVLTATISKEGAVVKDSNGVDTINQSLKARNIIHKEISQQQKVLGIGSLYQRQLLSIPDFNEDESVNDQNVIPYKNG